MGSLDRSSPEQLTRVLEDLRRDLDRISGVLSELNGSLPDAGPAATQPADPRQLISQREVQVFEHLIAGDPVPMIASRLHISEHTVRNHVKSIYRKLGVNSRVQLLCRFSESAARTA